MAVLTTRYWDPVRRSNDQKLSWPASHKSCQAAWGEEFKARKHVVKMAPVVRPTPITINAVSAWGWVNGRSSMNRRLAIERFLLLTFCTWKCQMATVLCTYKQSGSISTKSKRNPINAEENQQVSTGSESLNPDQHDALPVVWIWKHKQPNLFFEMISNESNLDI